MTRAQLSNFTRLGLPGIDQVPFGMHACHFYRDRDELVGALVPYFVEGLRGNERCIWITAPPLPARQAVEALRAQFAGVDEALQADALRIIDFDEWYAQSAELKGMAVIEMWLQEEERALADGYSGLRITGNVTFLTPEGWPTFLEYEQAVSAHLNGRRILALCSYHLAQCGDLQVSEVLQAHHCGFEHRGGNWQVAS